MSDSMMQEILKRLDELTAKLGAGGAVVWETLMRKAVVIDGWLVLAEVMVALVVLAVGVLTAKWAASKITDDGDSDMYCAIAVIAGVASFVATLFTLFSTWDAIAHILNPQYYALRELAQMLTGK